MSERGSFCTEYIYCDRCFEIMKRILLNRDKSLCSCVVPHWAPLETNKYLPIIAGKIGSTYSGGEFDVLEEILNEATEHLCHKVRLMVMAESGVSKVYVIHEELVEVKEDE